MYNLYIYITDMNICVNIFLKHEYFLLIETNNQIGVGNYFWLYFILQDRRT